MKTIEFPQRTFILAAIFFIAGFALLMFTNLNKEYIGLIFLCIPVSFLAQKSILKVPTFYGFAAVIYYYLICYSDTNLNIEQLSVLKQWLDPGFIHWLIVIIRVFICMTISMIVLSICNPEILNSDEEVKVPEENPA